MVSQKRCSGFLRYGLVVVMVVMQIVLTASIYQYWSASRCPVMPVRSLSCGASVKEAKNKGCTLDVLAQAWIPPACHDSNFTKNDFGNYHKYSWFSEDDRSAPIEPRKLQTVIASHKDMNKLPQVWVERPWQIEHCLYMLRMTAHVTNQVSEGADEMWSYEHAVDPEYTQACMRAVTGQSGMNDSQLQDLVPAKFRYGRCARVV